MEVRVVDIKGGGFFAGMPALQDSLRRYPGNHEVTVRVIAKGASIDFDLGERFDCDGFDPDLIAELEALGASVSMKEAA